MSADAIALDFEIRPEPTIRPKLIASGVMGMLLFVFTGMAS